VGDDGDFLPNIGCCFFTLNAVQEERGRQQWQLLPTFCFLFVVVALLNGVQEERCLSLDEEAEKGVGNDKHVYSSCCYCHASYLIVIFTNDMCRERGSK